MKKAEDTIHMAGGTGTHSYCSNSALQGQGASESKIIIKEIIKQLLNEFNPDEISTLIIVDLGCSTGANTFIIISQILDLVEEFRIEKCLVPPEIMLFLNDLPRNDFNTLLGPILSSFKEKKKTSFPFYTATMPGSFYNRLFPRNNIHFFHSSYSIMWLSEVPQGLISEKTCAINKGNIYIAESSPPVVSELYEQQFKRDFCSFLKHRSEELCSNVGYMVLTLLGRKNSDPSEEVFFFLFCLTEAFNEMVSEGKLKASDFDAFNLPVYYPSMEEVKLIIEENGSFEIIHDAATSPWVVTANDGKLMADTMRAAFGPVFASHFGDAIIDDLFSIMAKVFAESFREDYNAVNLAISLKKKKTFGICI